MNRLPAGSTRNGGWEAYLRVGRQNAVGFRGEGVISPVAGHRGDDGVRRDAAYPEVSGIGDQQVALRIHGDATTDELVAR